MFKILKQLIIISIFFLASLPTASAFEMTSSSFKIQDPDINIGGTTENTSSTFKQKGTTGQEVTGESTSTSFKVRSGFQYYEETVSQTGNVTFSGFGPPNSIVVILDGGSVVATQLIGSDSSWLKTVQLSAAVHSMSLYAEDVGGKRTNTVGFNVTVTAGSNQSFSNIFFSPTMSISQTSIQQGQTLTMSGYAQNNTTVTVTVNSHTITQDTPATGTGTWNLAFSQTDELGLHSTYPKSKTGSLQSENGLVLSFTVTAACAGSDLNKDGRVNLTDFSILLFNWNQTPPGNVCADINKDGTVNLTDFSIMLFGWTG